MECLKKNSFYQMEKNTMENEKLCHLPDFKPPTFELDCCEVPWC